MTEDILRLFADAAPRSFRTVDSSRSDSDFRETVIAEYDSGVLPDFCHDRLVIKAASNGFTTPERIAMWARCAEEYRQLGAWCPQILPASDGSYPTAAYRGHRCTLYAETFSEYASADTFPLPQICDGGRFRYIDDAIRLTAHAAAKHFDFTVLPSAWCMYELFDAEDTADEVEENALCWATLADRLPQQFRAQTDAILAQWRSDRAALREIWHMLPRSVFQADLNPTNCLLDRDGLFVGLYDFNIAGSEVYLNYLFREIPYVTRSTDLPLPPDHEAESILHALRTASAVYRFSEIEREAAPLLWRVVKPLWYTEVERLRKAGNDAQQIAACLAHAEQVQQRTIRFADAMQGGC